MRKPIDGGRKRKEMLLMEMGVGQIISWTRFKEEFNDHFFSKVVQEAKAREFLDLVQCSMIVTEYAANFNQLLLFTAYLIPNKEKNAKKFERA